MKKFQVFLLLISLSFFILGPVNAALITPEKKAEMNTNLGNLATSTGYDTSRTLEDLIATIIRIVTSVLGAIFLTLAFVAGNNWMQAGGNEEKAKKSKETIRDLLIGLALVLIIYALASGLGGLLSGMLLAF